MTKIFISGSKQIKNINPEVFARIDNIVKSGFDILLGDADGVDSSIQKYLLEMKYTNVVIYCSGSIPRHNWGRWNLKPVKTSAREGTREYFTAKDLILAQDCDFGLMVWDTKSTGTLSNVIELIKLNKKSIVFINKIKEFKVVTNVDEFESLLMIMDPNSLSKARLKINLDDKLSSLKCSQPKLI